MPIDPLLSPTLPPSSSAALSGVPFQTAQRLVALAQQANAGQPQAQADLQRATQDFEAYFVTWLLREMRQTVPQSDLLPRGPTDETYEALYDDALGKSVSSGQGVGLAQLLQAKLRSLATPQAQPAVSVDPATQQVTIGGKR